jgi:hypothetical protein
MISLNFIRSRFHPPDECIGEIKRQAGLHAPKGVESTGGDVDMAEFEKLKAQMWEEFSKD